MSDRRLDEWLSTMSYHKPSVAIILLSLLVYALPCMSQPPRDSLTHTEFGKTAAGVAVEIYTLRNHRGMRARIATYGGIVTALTAPDRNGHFADVVLGYDSLASYVNSSPYFGSLIGR